MKDSGKLFCPFGESLDRIPEPNCNPRNRKAINMYVFCTICKEFQLQNRMTPLAKLPALFRRTYGPDSEYRNLDDFK